MYLAGNVGSTFAIDEVTGSIVTIQPTCAAVVPLYTLTVNATDRGVVPLTTSVIVRVQIVDVNTAAPEFVARVDDYAVVVSENAEPRVLLTVQATDADCGDDDDITYTMLSGDTSLFAVNRTSGEVALIATLDHEVEVLFSPTTRIFVEGHTWFFPNRFHIILCIVSDRSICIE